MIFYLRESDIETCGFSDIIFAPNARRHITCEANITGVANITRRKANITENDKFLSKLVVFWQGQKDSNPRHAVLETAALPTELYPYIGRSP